MQRYDADGKKIGELVEDFGALEKDSEYCYLYDPEDQTLLDASFQKVPLSVDSGEIVLVEPLYCDWSRPGYCPLLVRTVSSAASRPSSPGTRRWAMTNGRSC